VVLQKCEPVCRRKGVALGRIAAFAVTRADIRVSLRWVSLAPILLTCQPSGRVVQVSAAGSLPLTLTSESGGLGRLPPQVVIVAFILVLLVPGSIPRPSRLRILGVPSTFSCIASREDLVPVFLVPLPLPLAGSFGMIRVSLSPTTRSVSSFTFLPLFL
jgi:hypothetical protein